MRRILPAFRRVVFLTLLAACGSRTGLFVDDDGFTDVTIQDAGRDARRTLPDGAPIEEDAEPPPPPPLDARPVVDANRTDCADAGTLLIYTITDSYELQSFDPITGTFDLIGKIACPTPSPLDTPFSMAVDRRGIAYVLFNNLHIYRVSTATAACVSTSYVPRQSNFLKFGMGFATNSVGPTETLYVAGSDQPDENGAIGASGLAQISTSTFSLDPVADFSPSIDQAELTGTGDGRLFAFYTKGTAGAPSFIGEIDTATANVVGERAFPQVNQGRGWAFAYWGGDFYMFHAPDGHTHVTRWRPADDSVVEVANAPGQIIVGAGVSTCAPQE
jgi:hypothetical protein